MFTLQLGRLQLAVRIPEPALCNQMSQRYAPFLHTETAPDLIIHVGRLTPQGSAAPQPPVSPAPMFARNRIIFNQPGFQGALDPEQQQAEIKLSPHRAADSLDYFLRVCAAAAAYRAGGLLLHAAGVRRGRKVGLFFGHSGSGKTTVARLAAPETVLNDDLILLLPTENGWQAYGTPFTNPSQTPPSALNAPAGALFRLVQSATPRLAPLRPALALAELLASVPVLNGAPEPPVARCQQLLDDLPAYHLYFRPDPSFWTLVDPLLA